MMVQSLSLERKLGWGIPSAMMSQGNSSGEDIVDNVLVGHIVDIVLVETNCAHQHSTMLCFRGIYIFPDMTLAPFKMCVYLTYI